MQAEQHTDKRMGELGGIRIRVRQNVDYVHGKWQTEICPGYQNYLISLSKHLYTQMHGHAQLVHYDIYKYPLGRWTLLIYNLFYFDIKRQTCLHCGEKYHGSN